MPLAQNPAFVVIALTVAVVFFVMVAAVFRTVSLWLLATMTGVPLGLFDILGMRFRRVDPRVVVRALITAKQVGIEMSFQELVETDLEGM